MILALLLLLVQPTAPATPPTLPRNAAYRTEIRERYAAFGYTGVMRLRIANGYVNGTYRPDSGGTITPLSGGTDGSHIWFDLETLGGVHVEAHLEHGKIVGLGSSRYGRLRTWVFTATPISPYIGGVSS